MKKKVFYVSVLFVGLMAAIFSCSKKEAAHQKQQNPQMSERHIEINRLITTFKTKMADIRKNPNAKSSEAVPADSALWYLEATINYSHGFPNEYYQEFTTDSLTLTIAKNSEGKVNLTELTAKYDQMKTEVAAAYHASAYGDKGLAVVDLEKETETDNEITISVKSITGKINPNPDTLNNNFLGDWKYGENGGYCNGSGGEYDASEQFLARIYYLIANYGKTNSFFTDIIEVEVQGGNPDFMLDSNIEPDNHLDYYLYYSIEGSSIPWNEDMLCIPNADMHTYNDLIYDLLFDFLPNEYLPATNGGQKYYIMECLYFYDGKDIDNANEIYEYYHYGKFKYGYDTEYTAGNNPTEIQ